MKLKPIVLIAAALSLIALSNMLELRGDLAPVVASGVSGERAAWHLLALAVLLGALGCFIAAGVSALRGR